MALKRRSRLSVLQKKARSSLDNTRAEHEKVKKKRAENKSKKKVVDKADPSPTGLPSFDISPKSTGQTNKDSVSWFYVHELFLDGIFRNNRSWLGGADVSYRDKRDRNEKEAGNGGGALGWVYPDKNCARMMLERYGQEVVEKVVAWFCDNWQTIKDNSNGVLQGAPTVRLLWSSRERFFPDALEGKTVKKRMPLPKKKAKKHMVGEYNAESARKSPRVGWRKDV